MVLFSKWFCYMTCKLIVCASVMCLRSCLIFHIMLWPELCSHPAKYYFSLLYWWNSPIVWILKLWIFLGQAKFLKSCGALLETPGEIRKASQRTVSHNPHEEKSSSNFHSWLPGTSLNKLLWDEPLDHHSSSPKKHVYEDSQSPGKVYGR